MSCTVTVLIRRERTDVYLNTSFSRHLWLHKMTGYTLSNTLIKSRFQKKWKKSPFSTYNIHPSQSEFLPILSSFYYFVRLQDVGWGAEFTVHWSLRRLRLRSASCFRPFIVVLLIWKKCAAGNILCKWILMTNLYFLCNAYLIMIMNSSWAQNLNFFNYHWHLIMKQVSITFDWPLVHQIASLTVWTLFN